MHDAGRVLLHLGAYGLRGKGNPWHVVRAIRNATHGRARVCAQCVMSIPARVCHLRQLRSCRRVVAGVAASSPMVHSQAAGAAM
eukprot:14022628-Alexandrium_andersonii.AAC.1